MWGDKIYRDTGSPSRGYYSYCAAPQSRGVSEMKNRRAREKDLDESS